MKHIPSTLTVLLIVIALVGTIRFVDGYLDSHQSAWQVESAAKAVMNVKDYDDQLRNEALRRQLWTNFYQIFGLVLILITVGGAAIYGWKKVDERRECRSRMIDGSFPLQQLTSATGHTWLLDPNKSQFGTIGFDKGTGQLVTDANMVGPDRQLAYVSQVQRTRTAQATAITEIRNSAQAKYAAGYYDKPQQPVRVVNEDVPMIDDSLRQVETWQPLSLVDAFKRSDKDRWILGQNDQGPFEFNIGDVVHTALVGATKTGKTSSTALLMALNARKQGMHVIALDGAGGMDWDPYSDIFEVYPTDYSMIGDQLDEIVHMDALRKKTLKLADKPNIDELDFQIPSVFVILEEFGRTMQAFKTADKTKYELIESELSNLMRVSRKTGIYFLLMDQSVAGWSKFIKANVKDYISYFLGASQGNAFNAYNLHELKPKGQFWNNGQFYDAWHTRAETGAMKRLVTPQRVRLLTGGYDSDSNDSTIIDMGGSTIENDSGLPPQYDSAITLITPVSDSTITSDDSGGSTIKNGNSTIKPPYLQGRPLSRKDKELIKNTYALSNKSRRKTVETLYETWTPSRDKWVKAVLEEGEILQ